MPQSFGVREVIPLLPDFRARHPALNLSFSMSDQRQDTIKEGVNLALRTHGMFTPVRSPKPAARALVEYLAARLRG